MSVLDNARRAGLDPERVDLRSACFLLALLALGFALRLAFLLSVTGEPGFEWDDPDGYARNGRLLAGDGTGWRWTFDAVAYSYRGHAYSLPPLYPIFLSLFAVFPGYPFTAQVAETVLGALTILLVFDLARRLHSTRAGLIAAALFALWFPNFLVAFSTSQETLYLPLVVWAFVLYLRACSANPSGLAFIGCGLVFGLAALTRSMPLFFTLPAAMLHVLLAPHRRRALGEAGALLFGFALLTAPYSVAASLHHRQLVLIENHGGILRLAQTGSAGGSPSIAQTAAAIRATVAATPRQFVDELEGSARSVLQVHGGRLLQVYLRPRTRVGAWIWKWLVHLSTDLLFVASLLLTPFGLMRTRQRGASAFIVLWIAVNVFLITAAGAGGPRLRKPFEPHLVSLAALVLAGGYPSRKRGRLAVGTAMATLLAIVVLPQLPRSLAAWPDYGVRWIRRADERHAWIEGAAGFNVPALDGEARLKLHRTRDEPPHSGALVKMTINGRPVPSSVLRGIGPRELRYPVRGSPLVYLELSVTNGATGEPESVRVHVPVRPRGPARSF